VSPGLTEAPVAFESFRDPAGRLILRRDRVLRIVNPDAIAGLEAFFQSTVAREATRAGSLVGSRQIADAEIDGDYVLEHERISFPSYPYEWPPEMLHAAAALTLDLAQRSLDEGFGLKDATPYNILFRGGQPVFVDVLSFENRTPEDPVWMAYGQFVRTFLLPLVASRYLGVPLQLTLGGRRDGLEPETVYRWAGFRRRWKPPFLSLVSLPKWFGARGKDDAALYRPKAAGSAEQARFILGGLLRSCRRQLASLDPGAADSTWSGYLDRKSLYSPHQLAQKEAFVREALALAGARQVLDVGANEGHFSFLAADAGCSVVAIDSDPVVVGSIWRRASRERLDVLPLVVDLARPTPAIGWRNQECASFLDRSRGSFDCVMMLAVLHHLIVTERVPMDDLLRLVEELTREFLLIEFVAPEDPMFQRIMRGREALYSDWTNRRFEQAAAARFELLRSTRIDGLHRWLYLFRRKHVTG
jgi:Methyltransferase domain